MKRIFARIAMVAAMLAGGLFFSPAAHAAGYGCGGSEIDSYAVKTSGGTVYGYIHLYYDSSTGKNCAVNVATAAGGAGTATVKNVYMARCVAGSTAGKGCSVDLTLYDPPFGSSTKFTSYAGPVSFNAAGRCILIGGAIVSPAGNVGSYSSLATHCG
ncbi:hypothetical protein [Streptomyces sp. BE147]|uniref:hypothetical protein n=1 Tax=unclassified Streptomyces TaxID=2593676 RepID=UPI002E768A0A|nr:hypothetical protein [Streptomyces sp. BE147]MEE1739974.1 hypothetical protein [Streptomyces sp. BE147]